MIQLISLFFISGFLAINEARVPFSHRLAKFSNSEGAVKFVYFDENDLSTDDPPKIDVNKVAFHLYTKKNPTASQRLFINDTDALDSSNYDITLETKLIVHGFFNNIDSDTIQIVKNNFLNQSERGLNVIGVDWSYYTMTYTDVLHKSKGVGLIIGELVDFLVTKGAKLEDVHFIGHSLGAHACGFAGASMKSGKVSRITGLDPALPGFDVSNMENRLDSSDAMFVDCIHTCGGFLGMFDPICTADYYPNGGKEQPGCNWFDFGTCSHGRSHQLFAESIINGHQFPSKTCISLNFGHDQCLYSGALMGYPATYNHTGILFTTTNAVYPYSMNITSVK